MLGSLCALFTVSPLERVSEMPLLLTPPPSSPPFLHPFLLSSSLSPFSLSFFFSLFSFFCSSL